MTYYFGTRIRVEYHRNILLPLLPMNPRAEKARTPFQQNDASTSAQTLGPYSCLLNDPRLSPRVRDKPLTHLVKSIPKPHSASPNSYQHDANHHPTSLSIDLTDNHSITTGPQIVDYTSSSQSSIGESTPQLPKISSTKRCE